MGLIKEWYQCAQILPQAPCAGPKTASPMCPGCIISFPRHSSFSRSKACPVPRYGARIHALTPRGKTSMQRIGTPLRSQCSAGACPPLRSATRRQPLRRTTPAHHPTPTIPVEAGFKPAWGGGKWQHPPAGRFVIPSPPHRHSRAEPAPYPDTGRESTHQSPTVKRRSNDRESLTRSM